MSIDDIKSRANFLRAEILDVGKDVKDLKDNVATVAATAAAPPIDFGEAIANAQLAYRHLEDARHRLADAVIALGRETPHGA